MNRYPLWKYLVIAVALVIGVLYSLPNLFGESPAVQVSAARSSVRVDSGTVSRGEQALSAKGIQATMVQFEGNSVRARFESTDVQIKARDAIEAALNPDPTAPGFVVALNLVPRTALGHRCLADVPGAGPARWRAFHAAGGHAGGAAAPGRGAHG